MRRFVLLALVVVLTFCMVFSGCGQDKGASKDSTTAAFDPSKVSMALVSNNKGHPVVQLMGYGFLDGAKKLGYTQAQWMGSDGGDIAPMISLAEAAAGQGIKAVVIPVIDQSVYPVVKKLKDAGAYVISAHFAVDSPETCPGLDAWCGPDSSLYAKACAEAIGEKLGGKGTVAITQSSFNNLENNVATVFKQTMNEKYPDIKVLDPVVEGTDPAKSIAAAVALIQANPDIKGALSTTGGGPTTWAGAKDQTNRQDIVVIGMDTTAVNLDLVKKGKVLAVVGQPLYEEFVYAVEMCDKLLRGGKVEFANPMDSPLIYAENVDEYEELLKKVEEYFK
jgi:ribose transport system substrate-binding protein